MLVGILIAVAFIACILFVIFGQVTVRKLRKNPETRHELGIEFISGWDILNVAEALTLPKFILEKTRNNPQGGSVLFANHGLLCKHTTRFDRVLARMLYTLYLFSGFGLIILVILNWLGVFD